MTPDDFIASIAPAAQQSEALTGVPASFTIAEAALESAWGTSGLACSACNLFGVKADPGWCGPTVSIQTREFIGGSWCMQPASWRKYPDWSGCMADHAAFLHNNKRYADCFLATNGEDFARAVQKAGYATDPAYADKLIAIMRAHNLAQYDGAKPDGGTAPATF